MQTSHIQDLPARSGQRRLPNGQNESVPQGRSRLVP